MGHQHRTTISQVYFTLCCSYIIFLSVNLITDDPKDDILVIVLPIVC